MEKHTEPWLEQDGVYNAANACKQCGLWLVPDMVSIPQEQTHNYCWGHNWAIIVTNHYSGHQSAHGPYPDQTTAKGKAEWLAIESYASKTRDNFLVVEMQREPGTVGL